MAMTGSEYRPHIFVCLFFVLFLTCVCENRSNNSILVLRFVPGASDFLFFNGMCALTILNKPMGEKTTPTFINYYCYLVMECLAILNKPMGENTTPTFK